jgi:NADP-reducing hydrogenase subunit HndB
MDWKIPMKTIQSLEDLQRFREEIIEEKKHKASPGKIELVVSMGSCGIAAGALDVFHEIENQIKAHNLKDIIVSQTGCIGLCRHEPILAVIMGDTPKVTYGKVLPELVKHIIREHILAGKVVEEFVIDATPFPTI